MMARLCYVCSSAAVHACRFCGRPVCDRHYDAAKTACTECLKGRRA